jgi:hypothetical protein
MVDGPGKDRLAFAGTINHLPLTINPSRKRLVPMESNQTPSGVRGACPCCGADDRPLVVCRRCDWAATPTEARSEAKQRLHEFNPGSGFKAYNPRGCYVCETCSGQVGTTVLACPLRLFYEAGLPADKRALPATRQFGDAVCLQWERWLAARDWPETEEIHWRRLVDHMVGEKEQA